LYSAPEDWSGGPPIAQLAFDDPTLVDAEPVAVYEREIKNMPARREPARTEYVRPLKLKLGGGEEYAGPMGYVENLAVRDAIRSPIPWHPSSSPTRIDPRKQPVIPPPPNVTAIAFYAAHRDRFDDAERPRVPGAWEKLLVVPLESDGALRAWLPSNPLIPTVSAGLDRDGKIARWTGTATDANGGQATYYAFAGDHYSDTRINGYHYCNGCHTGHTYTSVDLRERPK
jgi:hypothetical protein